MTAKTSWFWLHVSDCGHLQHGATPEMTREQAEQYGQQALLPENWILSVPQPSRNTFMGRDEKGRCEASKMAARLRNNYFAMQKEAA